MTCYYCEDCLLRDGCKFSFDRYDSCACDDIIKYNKNEEEIESIFSVVFREAQKLKDIGYEDTCSSIVNQLNYIEEDSEDYHYSMFIKIILHKFYNDRNDMGLDDLIKYWGNKFKIGEAYSKRMIKEEYDKCYKKLGD